MTKGGVGVGVRRGGQLKSNLVGLSSLVFQIQSILSQIYISSSTKTVGMRPTDKGDHKDAEEDPEDVTGDMHEDDGDEGDDDIPEDVAGDVHEDDGDEGDGQACLALPLLALATTQHLPGFPG